MKFSLVTGMKCFIEYLKDYMYTCINVHMNSTKHMYVCKLMLWYTGLQKPLFFASPVSYNISRRA